MISVLEFFNFTIHTCVVVVVFNKSRGIIVHTDFHLKHSDDRHDFRE